MEHRVSGRATLPPDVRVLYARGTGGMNFAAHDTYADGGNTISEGADFAASRLGAQPPHETFGN